MKYAKVKTGSSQIVGECRRSSLQRPMFEPPKYSSSITLSVCSSQPLVVQSNRPHEQTKAPPLVSDSGYVYTTSDNAMLGLAGDALLSSQRALDTLRGSHEAGSLDSLERVNGLSPGSELSKPLDSSEPDYAEILKTPTQKSHRFDLVINRRVNDECGVESDDGLPVIDQPLTGLLTSLQVLCSTCQSQRVLAKIPNQVIQW